MTFAASRLYRMEVVFIRALETLNLYPPEV